MGPAEERLLKGSSQREFSEGWISVLRHAAGRSKKITIFIDGVDQLRAAPFDSHSIVPSEHVGKIVWVFSKTHENVMWAPTSQDIYKTHILEDFPLSDKINFIRNKLEPDIIA